MPEANEYATAYNPAPDAKLERPWPVRSVNIPAGPLMISMEVIDRFDDMLADFARTNPDDTDMIPYFADVWPSAIALAQYLTEHPGLVQDKIVIELGCGLGLPAIVAAKLGAARVTATDFHPACLPYLMANTRHNGVPEIICRTLDWRQPASVGTFDCIIGSDLLYEAPQIATLLDCIAKIGTPSTRLILADPLRRHVQAAADQLTRNGWQIHDEVIGEILILSCTHHPGRQAKKSG